MYEEVPQLAFEHRNTFERGRTEVAAASVGAGPKQAIGPMATRPREATGSAERVRQAEEIAAVFGREDLPQLPQLCLRSEAVHVLVGTYHLQHSYVHWLNKYTSLRTCLLFIFLVSLFINMWSSPPKNHAPFLFDSPQ